MAAVFVPLMSNCFCSESITSVLKFFNYFKIIKKISDCSLTIIVSLKVEFLCQNNAKTYRVSWVRLSGIDSVIENFEIVFIQINVSAEVT